jgi:DNA-3-methyladenine glycosylase II
MFKLEPKGPFSWQRSIDVLQHWAPVRRFHPGAEIRFLLDGDFTPVRVKLREDAGALVGEVEGTRQVERAARQVARIFSLDHDGSGFHDLPGLTQLQHKLAGLRPVCFPSPYEAAIWAVLSQRVSMEQAARLEASLLEDGFLPPPDRLKRLDRGLPVEKLRRLHAVAEAADWLDADRLRALGDVEAPALLRRIHGIGPFWSQGIYLRACGIRDVWPDEPRCQLALKKLGGDPDQWRPYRMWAAFLLRVADARGLI